MKSPNSNLASNNGSNPFDVNSVKASAGPSNPLLIRILNIGPVTPNPVIAISIFPSLLKSIKSNVLWSETGISTSVPVNIGSIVSVYTVSLIYTSVCNPLFPRPVIAKSISLSLSTFPKSYEPNLMLSNWSDISVDKTKLPADCSYT